ncbi:methyltransferase domain protein [Ceratobasidium sp. AG-Ba]|nr:methyltransferase domain protein [Ceratobasidium sp. AG-Ba]QRW04427.1 methyltransferase domain protein [Ceratobasidium sp. AG-Ba]
MGVFAYYDADTDAMVYHVIPSPESDLAPSNFHSETESLVSAATIESNDLPGYFILHHGRQQPANDNAIKWFPSDNIRRYMLRYLVLKSIFGGDYIGPVMDALSPVEGRERYVLEVGTRTGTWIQAMATQFSHVQFLSLDVVPMIAHAPRPNVAFEVYDFTAGLLLEDESQDAVFLNVVLEMVKDYRSLLREVYRILRPGGLIYIRDLNPHFWDTEDIMIPAHRTNPYGCRFFDLIRRCISSAGIDPDTCDKLPQWLLPGSDLWNQEQVGFKDIHSVIRPFPVYPHDGFSCMNRIEEGIATYLRQLTAMSLRDMSGLLRDTGMGGKEADELIEGMLEELRQPESSTYVVYCIIGSIKY